MFPCPALLLPLQLRKKVLQMLDPASLHSKLKGMSLTIDLKALRNVNVQGMGVLKEESGTSRLKYEVK